jgi:hypothetical protein
MPSGNGSSGDDNVMTPGDAILSAQEVKEDLQGRTSEPRATHKAWLFAGSDRGGQRAALLYSVIVTAKLNDIFRIPPEDRWHIRQWRPQQRATRRLQAISRTSSKHCCTKTAAQGSSRACACR